MRLSRLFAPTLKEIPAEADTANHQLLLRAGMIRKLTSGIYTYLPLAFRVMEKMNGIIREELNRIGAQELLMPVVQPAELWRQTGRWEKVSVLFKLKDRTGRDFLLGPTHEEVITSLVAREVKSYRNLPLLLYQIQTKFRDEPRPRGGIIRGREFLMMDLYSFHRTREDLEETYRRVVDAYLRIYKRCGFDIRVIEGETGDIGGDTSHQFELITESGEDRVILCSACSYAADVWAADFRVKKPEPNSSSLKPMEKVHTPGCKTVEDVAKFLGSPPHSIFKTLIYEVDGRLTAVCLHGDRELNELKLKKYLKAGKLSLASAEKAGGFDFGSIGPVQFTSIPVVGDEEIQYAADAACGANEKDYHYRHVSFGRDFRIQNLANLRFPVSGDLCPRCGAGMEEKRGIELGQTFILGTLYSEPLGCTYREEDGTETPMVMGTYGIGVSRMIASLVEQSHDEEGIQWPVPVAPYECLVLCVNVKDPAQSALAEKLYEEIEKAGFEVVLDDRDVRAGVKFKDADLLGFPFRVTVGQKAEAGNVEIRIRGSKEAFKISTHDVARKLSELKQEALRI